MAKPVATPSYQFFGCFNAFFSTIWQKTQVGLVSLKVFHLWRILGHPKIPEEDLTYVLLCGDYPLLCPCSDKLQAYLVMRSLIIWPYEEFASLNISLNL